VADVETRTVPGTSPDDDEHTRRLDPLLDELVAMLSRCGEYNRFVQDKAAEAMKEVEADRIKRADDASIGARSVRSDSVSSTSGLRPNSELQMLVMDTAMQYIRLEQHFMTESLHLAIRIDEHDGTEGSSSSMVEDCFFVLRKCGERAVATHNIQVIQAMVMAINEGLSSVLKTALVNYVRNKEAAAANAKVVDAFTNLGGGAAPEHANSSMHAAYVALNNLEVSSKHSLKLKECLEAGLEEGASDLDDSMADLQRQQLEPLLADLGEIAVDFEQTVDGGQSELWSSKQQNLQSVLDGLATVNCQLSESQHDANQAENLWVQQVIDALGSQSNSLKSKLTPGNTEGVIQKMVLFVVQRVETLVTSKQFNQLGGLQLDRDVRSLLGFFKGVTSIPVRDKFSRLTQIACILSMERPQEVEQYWGTSAQGWTLANDEVIKVLKLRVDFSADEIVQVSLNKSAHDRDVGF